jgi:DNA-binding XRE family transcriptional regulator
MAYSMPRRWRRESIFGTGPRMPMDRERRAVWNARIDAIRRRREDLGLSQRAMAKGNGLTHRIVCGAENGSINMTIRTMARLAAAVDGEIPEMLMRRS